MRRKIRSDAEPPAVRRVFKQAGVEPGDIPSGVLSFKVVPSLESGRLLNDSLGGDSFSLSIVRGLVGAEAKLVRLVPRDQRVARYSDEEQFGVFAAVAHYPGCDVIWYVNRRHLKVRDMFDAAGVKGDDVPEAVLPFDKIPNPPQAEELNTFLGDNGFGFQVTPSLVGMPASGVKVFNQDNRQDEYPVDSEFGSATAVARYSACDLVWYTKAE